MTCGEEQIAEPFCQIRLLPVRHRSFIVNSEKHDAE